MELHFAHSKLDLYFYENELIETGVLYSVCIQDDETYSIIDLFKPVV